MTYLIFSICFIWAIVGCGFFVKYDETIRLQPQRFVFCTLCGPIVWVTHGVVDLIILPFARVMSTFIQWLTKQ